MALEQPGGREVVQTTDQCPTSVMIPDGVTEGMFVTLSLAPVFIFQSIHLKKKTRLYII